MRHPRRAARPTLRSAPGAPLNLLLQLSNTLSDAQPLPKLVEWFTTSIEELPGVCSIGLATYSEADNLLHFHAVLLDGDVQSWPPARADEHPFGRAMMGRERRAGTIVADWSEHEWLVFPLIYAGMIVGVLAVGPTADVQQYRAALETATNLMAAAIYMSLRLGSLELVSAEQASALAGISEIARELNATLDIQQIVDLVLVHALGTTAARAGAVLMATDTGELRLIAQQGVDPRTAATMQSQSLILELLLDAGIDREYRPGSNQPVPARLQLPASGEAYSVFPLCHEDRLLGVLLLAADGRPPLATMQLRFLQQLTEHAALALNNAHAYTEIQQQHLLLDRRLAQLQAVAHISQAISAHLNLEALLPEIVSVVRSTLGYRIALLSLIDPAAPEQLRRVAAIGLPEADWHALRDEVMPLDRYAPLMTDEFRISRSFYIPHDHSRFAELDHEEQVPYGYRPELGERAPGEWHADDTLLVPLYGHQGGLVGILSVDDPEDRQRPTPATITVLEIFATQAATAIGNARLYAEMERQALTDNLTGIANQRHFMMHLSQHLSWAERHEQRLAMLALDIDHFKRYNDGFGHLSGNIVLREFADILRENVRSGDIVARWGGEEFFALLPQSTCEGAIEVAERIRHAVKQHPFPERLITVSIGVAVLQPGMEDHDLLSAADQALYRAKVTRDTVST